MVPLKPEEESEQAYRRVYTMGPGELLDAFQKEMKYPHRKSLTLTELKEFTYWLFKYRVKISEKPKIASDTKKALALMYRKMSFRIRLAELLQLAFHAGNLVFVFLQPVFLLLDYGGAALWR